MNLTDKEILELNELCNALVDGAITPAQQARLSQWLAASEEARQYYVRAMGLSASLFEYAGELQSEQPDAVRAPARAAVVWWTFGALAAAALVAATLWLGGIWKHNRTNVASETDTEEFVALLTGAKDCQWSGDHATRQPGDPLRHGECLELAKGIAEITFDCGAQVVLEGPATLDLNSAWDATLQHGTLKASVPTEAIGFRISNSAVDIVDLGTEFSMIADVSGATEVYVLKGAVQAAPRDASGREQPTMLLREDQSRRFSSAGVTEINDREQKVKKFSREEKLQRVGKPVGYAHWSFDEADGRIARAETSRMTAETSFDAQLTLASNDSGSSARTDGRWQRALRFDGQLSARAPFPGLSTGAARTVAFWVKAPGDIQLSNASAVVAWAGKGRKGAHPVRIGWNNDPALGALGALCTEIDRGYTVGTTLLRDGRWHHVAVVFVPSNRANTRPHVKQYVDGHLEAASSKQIKKRRPEAPPKFAPKESLENNVVWLGREHFRGDLDELYIADRALAPQEIKRLITSNQLPLLEVATAK